MTAVEPHPPLTDPRTLALRLLALRVLKDEVAAADAALRAEVAAAMLVGDRVTATLDTYDVPGGDGQPEVVGHVQLTKGAAGKRDAVVTDEAALLRWVQAQRPTEVVTTERVRPAFLRVLLDSVRQNGCYVDSAGVMHSLPGVEVVEGRQGNPTLTVKPVAGGADAIKQAWRDGRLSVADVTALPAGEA